MRAASAVASVPNAGVTRVDEVSITTTPTTSERLTSWSYDRAEGGKGMVTASTSWQAGQPYTWTTTRYTPRYLPDRAKQHVAGTYGTDLLAGDWKFRWTYLEDGQVAQVSTPTGPVSASTPNVNPAFATVTTGFNGFGIPDRAGTWSGGIPVDGQMFVTGTTFDGLGRVTGRSMSTTTNGTVATFVRDYGYHAPTGLVDRLRAGWNNGTTTSWFADDTITRDAVGRVIQVVDAGVEPDGSPSAVKECFVYDHQHRLVRAHTATPATGCATSTTTASVAPGSRDPYDTVWAFDDLQRITSRTNQLTAATTGYQYSGARPHAVTGLTGATTATYGYNTAGEMVGRDGTTLVWDPLGRLTVNGTTTSVYGSGPERLIHTAGSTRTLTLPGVDVVDQAGVRTVTRQITLAGTLVALAAGSQVWCNCASLSNTITCQTPAATTLTPPIPARKRFGPYGTARNGTVFAHTDRGYLGAPHDPTGLVHLQHRHLDPQLGAFISVDPLVTTTRQPYLYANGNPTTLTDPTGLEPACSARAGRGACGAEHADQGKQFAKAVVGQTLQPGEPSLRDQETMVAQTMGLSFPSFAGSWTEWYQMINLFYWVHRLVQAHISGTSGGRVMTEYTGCGGRIDLCANGLIGMEVAELKLLGVGGIEAARRSAQRQLQSARDFFGEGTLLASMGDPWPVRGSLLVGPMVVSWANQNLGLYTYEISGVLPTLPAWRDFKATTDLRDAEVRLRDPVPTPVNWGPIGWIAGAIATGIVVVVGGAACAGTAGMVCPLGAA